MTRSTASQASRHDANPRSRDWPRVGAKIEGGTVVVRVLEEGENPCPPVQQAVLVAEPCERFPNLADAVRQAANAVVARLERAGCVAPVVVRV